MSNYCIKSIPQSRILWTVIFYFLLGGGYIFSRLYINELSIIVSNVRSSCHNKGALVMHGLMTNVINLYDKKRNKVKTFFKFVRLEVEHVNCLNLPITSN